MIVSLGARTSSLIAGTPVQEIRTGATPGRAKLLELGVFLAESTASTIALGRPQELGLNPVSAVNFLPEDPVDVIASGVLQSTVAWGDILVEDCEDAWNEATNGDITCTSDAADHKVGAASAKFAIAAGATAGDFVSEEIASADFSTANTIRMWAKCSVDTAAGNLQLLLDDTASCASPIETLNIPALTADVWKQVSIPLANPASDTAIISVGMKYAVDIGACDIWFDDIQAAEDPKVPSAFLRRISLPGTTGTGVIWTFPKGITVPVSNSLALWNITDGGLLDTYSVFEI